MIAALSAQVPAKQKLRGGRRLLVCADDAERVKERRENDNCMGRRVRVEVTSSALLEAAVRGHRLSPARATGLEVLALNGDRRLPRRYRGDGGGEEGTAVAIAAVTAFDRMPLKLKGQVASYLLPPTAQISKSELAAAKEPCDANEPRKTPRPPWRFENSPRTGVKFWWKDDGPLAKWHKQLAMRTLPRALDHVWPALTGLMGSPVPDDKVGCEHGPDELLDVYLADAPRKPPEEEGDPLGGMFPYTCRDNRALPSFVELYPRRATSKKNGIEVTLAHELMHVLQAATPVTEGCRVPHWVNEGIADWSETYVYRGIKPTADWLPNANASESLTSLNRAWRYWSSPWWHAVTRGFDPEGGTNNRAIADLYDLMRTRPALFATDALIGGFARRWPEFARLAWNQDPLEMASSSRVLGGISDHPEPPAVKGNLSKPSMPLPGAYPLGPLSRHYDRFEFRDAAVRLIETTSLPSNRAYRLLAFYRVGSKWKEFDATGGLRFCRDNAKQNISELILISTNSDVKHEVESKGAALSLSASCSYCEFELDAEESPVTCTPDQATGREN